MLHAIPVKIMRKSVPPHCQENESEDPALSMLSWRWIEKSFQKTHDRTVHVCVELAPYSLADKQRLWVLTATVKRLGGGGGDNNKCWIAHLDTELFKLILDMLYC